MADFNTGNQVEWRTGTKRCRASWPTMVKFVQRSWNWTGTQVDGVWGTNTQRQFRDTWGRAAGLTIPDAQITRDMVRVVIALVVGRPTDWQLVDLDAATVLPRFSTRITDRAPDRLDCATDGTWEAMWTRAPVPGAAAAPTARTPAAAAAARAPALVVAPWYKRPGPWLWIAGGAAVIGGGVWWAMTEPERRARLGAAAGEYMAGAGEAMARTGRATLAGARGARESWAGERVSRRSLPSPRGTPGREASDTSSALERARRAL